MIDNIGQFHARAGAALRFQAVIGDRLIRSHEWRPSALEARIYVKSRSLNEKTWLYRSNLQIVVEVKPEGTLPNP